MVSEINSPTRPAVTASARQAAKVKGYVNQQLEKTRKQVKTIDFISGVLVLVAFTIGFLLFAAMIDAWIWPLPQSGRWAFLTIWLGSCVGYTTVSIVPLLMKRINPDYAAKMIEEAKPSFSNSLINYVSLRKRPEGIRPAVLDAVSRQAATDLASVRGDAAVDQSKMIRIGFVLVGLTLLAVSYKILSPKDPLSTVARIFAPASDIAQPAVVTIEEVLPGDVEIFFGETLDVVARVSGRHQPEDVKLIYSTLDGQMVDQSLSMALTDEPRTYSGEVSMPGGGVQASLQYRVVAKDGVSRDYVVTVRPNPTIAIESLLFDPPDYTGLASRTLMGVGDIDAIEGTMVTINAVANLPIKSAEVELLNEVVNVAGDTELSYEKRFVPAVGSKYIMEVEGRNATQSILVKLDANREKPFATHYRLKFTSTDGNRNSQPNVYPIRVTPDLAPDVEIKNPVETDGQIPRNQVLAVDIVASDLDFKIDSVELSVDHNGRSLFSDSLSLKSNNGNRRVTARYLLDPNALGLMPGDVAVFHAIAKDNRMQGRKPAPNISRTQNYSVTIQRPEEESSEPVAKNPDAEGQNGEGQTGEGQTGEGQTGEGQNGEGQTGEGQTGEGQNGEGQTGEGQTGEGQTGEGQTGEGQNGEGQTGEGQNGEGQTGEGQTGEGQNGEGGQPSSSGSEMSGTNAEGAPSGESGPSGPGGGGENSNAMGTGAGGGTPQGEVLERDKTNFDHAKKATDMVLKKLSDQRYDPDPELLEKMNWTKADLENFLRRWEEMKAAADTGTPEAKKKYEKSLRSLGLRPQGGSRNTKTVNESAEGLGQDSAVNRPPAERVPDFNSFMRDLNRADDN